MLGQYTLLAVFDDSPVPKLIDAEEADHDRFTYFKDAPLKISARDDAILIGTSHSNSEQSYEEYMLAMLDQGKLKVEADFLMIRVHSCHLYQDEQLTLTPKSGGKGYWPIEANIRRGVVHNAEVGDCLDLDDPAGVKTDGHKAVFIWDAKNGGYATSSKALDKLRDEDAKLF